MALEIVTPWLAGTTWKRAQTGTANGHERVLRLARKLARHEPGWTYSTQRAQRRTERRRGVPRGETAPLHTSPDELFFGTAARDVARGVPSGSAKEMPARGAPEWPRVQSSAPRCALCASALSSSAVHSSSAASEPVRARGRSRFVPVSKSLRPASARFTRAPRASMTTCSDLRRVCRCVSYLIDTGATSPAGRTIVHLNVRQRLSVRVDGWHPRCLSAGRDRSVRSARADPWRRTVLAARAHVGPLGPRRQRATIYEGRCRTSHAGAGWDRDLARSGSGTRARHVRLHVGARAGTRRRGPRAPGRLADRVRVVKNRRSPGAPVFC